MTIKRLRKSLLLLVLVGCSPASMGQGLSLLGIPLDTLLRTQTPRVDRAYIVTYYGRLHLFAVTDRDDFTMRMVGSAVPLKYKPNLPWSIGLGVNYKWIGTELTVRLPLLGYDVARKGKTKQFGARVNLNRNHYLISAQYHAYRGFYLYNPELLQPDWLARFTTYPNRNDLRSQTADVHVLYQTNPLQFSVPATLLQREGQRRNAHSWVLGGFLTYQNIRADSALIPTALQTEFQSQAQLRGIRTLALGINGGYTKTFVFRKHFFTSLSVRPGVSLLLQQTTSVAAPSESRLKAGWEGIASLTLGYSTDNYYGGIYSSTSWVNRTFSQELINTHSDYIRLVVGKRLRYRPKGFVKKLPGI